MSNELKRAFHKHWPIQRVIITCEDCDAELIDTRKQRPAVWSPDRVTEAVRYYISEHTKRSNHTNIDVAIDPEPTKEINCTIRVGENSD